MPDGKKVRVSVDLEGDLARAFLKELGKRVARGGSSSKADQGRALIAEALIARGHKVEVPETNWGGNREPDKFDTQDLPAVDEGQRAAYAMG